MGCCVLWHSTCTVSSINTTTRRRHIHTSGVELLLTATMDTQPVPIPIPPPLSKDNTIDSEDMNKNDVINPLALQEKIRQL